MNRRCFQRFSKIFSGLRLTRSHSHTAEGGLALKNILERYFKKSWKNLFKIHFKRMRQIWSFHVQSTYMHLMKYLMKILRLFKESWQSLVSEFYYSDNAVPKCVILLIK